MHQDRREEGASNDRKRVPHLFVEIKKQVAMPLRGLLVIAVIISQVDLQGQSARTVPTELLKPVVAPFADGVPKEIANGPFPAHQIIANVYYVGTVDYASFLITSPKGHILINPDRKSSTTDWRGQAPSANLDVSASAWCFAPELGRGGRRRHPVVVQRSPWLVGVVGFHRDALLLGPGNRNVPRPVGSGTGAVIRRQPLGCIGVSPCVPV
jgi:hypothetical protein